MIITDASLRSSMEVRRTKKLHINPGDILTQTAKDYIKSQNIRVIESDNMDFKPTVSSGYVDEQGNIINGKPEDMTHLRGNILIPKTDNRIMFRGKLDSLESYILDAQITALEEGYHQLTDDLEEVLMFVRSILSCEVRDKTLEEEPLLGMSRDELRKFSHNPKEYFGVPHELPNYKRGKTVAKLHIVRTLSRECELWGVRAFESSKARPDLILALNRLSSCIYILICKLIGGKYTKE